MNDLQHQQKNQRSPVPRFAPRKFVLIIWSSTIINRCHSIDITDTFILTTIDIIFLNVRNDTIINTINIVILHKSDI